jgi:hypothetical protein
LLPILKHFFMTQNFTMLKTKADCDAVIAIANKEKSDLEFRKGSLERQSTSAAETAMEIQAELESLNAELAYLDGILATAPDGKFKDDTLAKFKKAEYRKFLLSRRENNYGVVAAIDKAYDIGIIENSIEVTDDFITAVTAHKNGL